MGADINPENVKFAKKNYPCSFFNIGNAENLSEYSKESFDAIVSIQTIEHLGHPKLAMKEFNRLLKNNGVLIGAIPINDRHILDSDSEAKEITYSMIVKNLFPTHLMISNGFLMV